jgi:hypothetical protein
MKPIALMHEIKFLLQLPLKSTDIPNYMHVYYMHLDIVFTPTRESN